MSRSSRKKANTFKGYTKTEKLMAALEKGMKQGVFTAKDKEVAYSLMRWYLTHHYLTPPQSKLAESLAKTLELKPLMRKRDHYLYAISDGMEVKLGRSVNIDKRMKTLQTGSARDLKELWRLPVGTTITSAKKNERQLHRLCSKFRVRGEWFELGCMNLVETFTAK